MKIHHLRVRTYIVGFCAILLLFQNCSVYKSDGRKDYDSGLSVHGEKGCYPFIDTNIAMQIIGAFDDLDIFKSKISDEENAYTCAFSASTHLLKQIHCEISQESAARAVLLKQNGTLPGATSVWDGYGKASFSGDNHKGYMFVDTDGRYSVQYLAVDGSELKGVECSLKISVADYNQNASTVHDALSTLTVELAVNNQN